MTACAALVRRGDPDRYLSAITAPQGMRGRLMVLYAFNLEVVRAPWVTGEAMIAEIRLQWWADVLDGILMGAEPLAHEVAGPLAKMVKAAGLDVSVLLDLVHARKFDIGRGQHRSETDFDAYINATAGGLMWQAAVVLGAEAKSEAVVRDFSYGAGVANLLTAVPALVASGRKPLFDPRPKVVAALARKAQACLRRARAKRKVLPTSCAAAMLAGWQADHVLKVAAKRPENVALGQLRMSEFQRRTSLLWGSMTSKW